MHNYALCKISGFCSTDARTDASNFPGVGRLLRGAPAVEGSLYLDFDQKFFSWVHQDGSSTLALLSVLAGYVIVL